MKLFLVIAIAAILVWLYLSRRSAHKSNSLQSDDSHSEATDAAARHMRHAIQFARAKRGELQAERTADERWRESHGKVEVKKLDALDGVGFEEFLEGLFRTQGYKVERTAVSGDFGADLILTKEAERIAVQAKRYRGSVGVSAVQEALSGMSYYHCDGAWVVSTGRFTKNAIILANKSGVRLIGRKEIGIMLAAQSSRSNSIKAGHD